MATRTAGLTPGRRPPAAAAGCRRLLAVLPAVLLLASAPGASAAPPSPQPLPLFRQALEQWPPAPHEVLLLHRGGLSPGDEERQQALEEARVRSGANASFHPIDLEGTSDPVVAALWPGQDPPETPWILVRAPGSAPAAPPVWAGPLSAALLDHLFESPARNRIAESLLRGATAVWVLLECGESVRDEAAVDVLTSSLRTLEKQLKPRPRTQPRSPLPLRIDFGLVRVTRSDLAEEFLVRLLEHGAPAVSSRPLAFAVFGRGRLLGPLTGRELDLEGIRRVCQLLISPSEPGGPQRPGRELLLGADWNRVFQPAPDSAQPPGSAGPPAPAEVPAPRGMLPQWMQWAAGAALAIAAGGTLWARRRRRV